MLQIFESILPIFALIVLGHLLSRLPLIDKAAWRGAEQLCFWLLYPVLLFVTILRADFAALRIDAIMVALIGAAVVMCTAVLCAWPLFRRFNLVAHSQYSSLFQCSVRWNGFIAFVIAERIFPPEGLTVVALAMAAIIIPINIFSVFVVTRFANSQASWSLVGWKLLTNPLILAVMTALALRTLSIPLYGPVMVAAEMIGRAALGMGLLTIGAGLILSDLLRPRLPAIIAVTNKLFVFPALLLSIGIMLGIDKQGLIYLALCGSVPTAMNGYVLARQLGGDAELYASIATLQTAISFVSIPLCLWTAGWLFGVQIF